MFIEKNSNCALSTNYTIYKQHPNTVKASLLALHGLESSITHHITLLKLVLGAASLLQLTISIQHQYWAFSMQMFIKKDYWQV